ncbi:MULTISPECIES: polysaccharide deacetylase family protein [unclassified Inquilinus]|uniref:polysaccharide deacetylase family protein n=1 Tax=unclassified Inquilinus TaxID=2645927 RepID=UPI003F906345
MSQVSAAPQQHDRFPYSAIVDRPSLRWPNGARVAVWVIPNIEHFLFDRPSSSIIAATKELVPDVLNYSWRDYGVRVGIWRMMEVMERYGVKGTVALNADVCRHYPRIIEAGNALGWEWMGHGPNNSTLMNGQAEEGRLVNAVVDAIEQGTGRRPRGWLSPALSESHDTLDLLAAAGIRYIADWVNDEQPYPMRVKTGSMLSLPYSVEINDYTAFLEQGLTGEAFGRMICDQFDGLYEDGARSGRVMAICLHPFLVGHPHRSQHFAKALAHITSHRDVWMATGGEIADWYGKTYGNI